MCAYITCVFISSVGAIPMKSSSMRQSASRPRIESASELESEDGYADQKSWNQSGP